MLLLMLFFFVEVKVGRKVGVHDLCPNNLVLITNLEHFDFFAHIVDRQEL